MNYTNLILISLALLMMSKSLAHGKDHPYNRNSCIAIITQRFFRINSTVAVLATNRPQPLIVNLRPSFLEDSPVQLISHNKMFSFLVIRMNVHKWKSCFCSNVRADHKALEYFIFVGNGDDIVNCLKAYCFRRLTNDRSQFIVCLDDETKNVTEKVGTVFELLWRHQQPRVVVLVKNLEEDIDVYTWFPFDSKPEVKLIDTCDGKSLRNNASLFQLKTPSNLNGKLLRVGMILSPPNTCDRVGGGYAGYDLDILESMAAELNFTLLYILAKDLRRENETDDLPWRGMVGPWNVVLIRIESGEIDIGIGHFILSPQRIEGLSSTTSYFLDKTQFFATRHMIFSTTMDDWLESFIMQTLVVHFVLAFAMHVIKPRLNGPRSGFGATAIMVWSLLTDLAYDISRLSPTQNIVWTASAVFALNMNTIYRSLLTSALARPLYTEKIQTVKDMIESDVPFLSNGGSWEKDNGVLTEEELAQLKRREIVCTAPLHRCLLGFESVPHFCISSFAVPLHFVGSTLPHLGFHPLDRIMGFFHTVMFARENFFLTRKMTIMILRAAQAGLLKMWYIRTLKNKKLCDLSSPEWLYLKSVAENRSVDKTIPTHPVNPLTMNHLYPQFYFLGIGLSLATAAFIFELLSGSKKCRIIWASLQKKRRKVLSQDSIEFLH